jgi:putative NADPH-quinone reductase
MVRGGPFLLGLPNAMPPKPRRILVIQGHPDAARPHFGLALAQAYVDGAKSAGHEVRVLTPAELDFPLLRSAAEWQQGVLPAGLRQAQADIAWAQHLALFFPLWLGDMPALLKGFLEQVARPGFAFRGDANNPFAAKGLKGRSARVVVTMGMPALVYRFYFRAHSVKNLERNILGFVGVAPIHATLVGLVESMSDARRSGWLKKLAELGRRAG